MAGPAISCFYQCFGSGNGLDRDSKGSVDPDWVPIQNCFKKGFRNCMLHEFSVGLEPLSMSLNVFWRGLKVGPDPGDPDPDSAKCLDPDRDSVNLGPRHLILFLFSYIFFCFW